MFNHLKIVIPTAGLATRMRPQSWSKPKPLISVAGRAALDHLLDAFHSVPGHETVEYVIIMSPYLGETQIPPYMKEHYPSCKVDYVVQSVMRGQSDALWLAREYLAGPMIMCFSDTLIETDFSFLANEQADGVAWVKTVPDPRRFGVAEVDDRGWVTRLVEKPSGVENKRVVVGCYYFQEGLQLISAIEEQLEGKKSLEGEYFLIDAINIMVERGLKIRIQSTDVWLDTGTIESILETNRYLLAHGHDNSQNMAGNNNRLVPPVFIHKSAKVTNSTIGPHVSIGAECQVTNSRVEDSILEPEAVVDSAHLKGSFVGRQACIQGRSTESAPMVLNIGDNSSVILT